MRDVEDFSHNEICVASLVDSVLSRLFFDD